VGLPPAEDVDDSTTAVPKKPKQKPKQIDPDSPPSFFALDRSATAKGLEDAARAMGTTPDSLRLLIGFVNRIEADAAASGLTPPEVANACITLLASALTFCPSEQRENVIVTLFDSLHAHLGRASTDDTSVVH
jgi:hypothetical protein